MRPTAKPPWTCLTGLALLIAFSGVSACSNVKPVSSTDEFLVVTKPPLSVPPEYNLRPPSPSISLPSEIPSADNARHIVFGTDFGKAASLGERALVKAAGGSSVPESLRALINFEAASRVTKNASFTRRLLAVLGMVESEQLDPKAEAARLDREREAIAQLTGGNPVIIAPEQSSRKLPGT